jgi:hypothetical protein
MSWLSDAILYFRWRAVNKDMPAFSQAALEWEIFIKIKTMESWQEESHNSSCYSARHECQQEPMFLNPRVIGNHRLPLTTFLLFHT